MIEQRSEAWFKARLGHLTASRANDALAEIKSGEAASRKNYRTELVVERLTGQREETFESDPMKWGTATEPLARSAYCNYADELVTQVGFLKHPTIAWVGASVDSEVNDDGLIEIKCPNTAQHISALINGMDPKHTAQIQFQLWVTGRKWCDFVSFDPRLPERLQLYVQRVARDEKYIVEKELRYLQFLHEVKVTVEKLEAYEPRPR